MPLTQPKSDFLKHGFVLFLLPSQNFVYIISTNELKDLKLCGKNSKLSETRICEFVFIWHDFRVVSESCIQNVKVSKKKPVFEKDQTYFRKPRISGFQSKTKIWWFYGKTSGYYSRGCKFQ